MKLWAACFRSREATTYAKTSNIDTHSAEILIRTLTNAGSSVVAVVTSHLQRIVG